MFKEGIVEIVAGCGMGCGHCASKLSTRFESDQLVQAAQTASHLLRLVKEVSHHPLLLMSTPLYLLEQEQLESLDPDVSYISLMIGSGPDDLKKYGSNPGWRIADRIADWIGEDVETYPNIALGMSGHTAQEVADSWKCLLDLQPAIAQRLRERGVYEKIPRIHLVVSFNDSRTDYETVLSEVLEKATVAPPNLSKSEVGGFLARHKGKSLHGLPDQKRLMLMEIEYGGNNEKGYYVVGGKEKFGVETLMYLRVVNPHAGIGKPDTEHMSMALQDLLKGERLSIAATGNGTHTAHSSESMHVGGLKHAVPEIEGIEEGEELVGFLQRSLLSRILFQMNGKI